MRPQEYLVNDINKIAKYIDKTIGIDYEITKDNGAQSGSITVFDIDYDEHIDLRKFITKNDLWLES